MNKKRFFKSINTRQIRSMSEEEYKSYEPSKEFIPWTYEKISNQAIQGIRWTPFHATCYLSHYDPSDDKIQPGSGHMYSQLFMKLRDLFQYLISKNKIILEDSFDVMTGNKTMCAENIIYLRHALENGFNDIPDIFMEFMNGMPCDTSVEMLTSKNEENVSHANSMIKDGGGYVMTYNNERIPFIITTKGLEYIRELLQHPNKEISINELYQRINPSMPAEAEVNVMETGLNGFTVGNDTAGASDEIDDETYDRLEDLEERIKQAISAEKIKLVEDLEGQRDELIQYIRESTFKGKKKKFSTDTDSRRSTVQQSITATIKKIGELSPALYQHLTKSIKKQRGQCIYQPLEEISWHILL